MTESLRERQAIATAAEIRRAFVELAFERSTEGFTLAEVAERAGVSERTLYRYYPNRQAIVEAILGEDAVAFDEELNRRRGGPGYGLDDPEHLAVTFAYFEERVDVVDFTTRVRATSARSAERTSAVRARVAAAGLDAADTEALTGLIRLLYGADAWLRLRQDDLDLTPEQAGHAVQWAVTTLIEAARTHGGPLRPSNGRTT